MSICKYRVGLKWKEERGDMQCMLCRRVEQWRREGTEKREGEGREKEREERRGGREVQKGDSHGSPSTLVCHIVKAGNGPPVIHLSQ